MVLARAVDRRMWLLNRLSGIPARFDATGLEAVQVAAAASLRAGFDWVLPHRRDLALCMALGLSPLHVMLGVLGRAAEPGSGGRQPAGMFGLRSARIVPTSDFAGAHVVQAAGIAYASKARGSDEVTLVTCDGRGAESGDWHEGLNFAAVHRLAVVCLVEDRGHTAREIPGERPADLLALRADGYGIKGEVIDGGDFDACAAAFARAVARARAGEGPTLLHARVAPLTSVSPLGARLAQEQLEISTREDPLERMRRRLQDARILDEDTDESVQLDCASVVAAALEEAVASAPPRAAAALDNVFARI